LKAAAVVVVVAVAVVQNVVQREALFPFEKEEHENTRKVELTRGLVEREEIKGERTKRVAWKEEREK